MLLGGRKQLRLGVDNTEDERVFQAEPTAGFGQSFWEDLRFLWRFWRCRNRVVTWRVPSDVERRQADEHPILARFGDQTLLVADVGAERWIVRDRDWWGWPDPPRYVFFALQGNRIVVAADFNAWPVRWEPGPEEAGTPEIR